MSRSYELWDIETGNIVGKFADASAAFDVIRTLLDANGNEIADALLLQCRDGNAEARGYSSVRNRPSMPWASAGEKNSG